MIVAASAEMGDCIFTFPTLKVLGNVDVVCPDRPWYRPNWSTRCLAVKRLAESQHYIRSFNPYQGEPIDLDLTTYRGQGHRHGDLITQRIARWARVQIDDTVPWLEVEPSPTTKGRIVINRAPRWQGYSFPWKAIVDTFKRDLLFVGLEDEWKTFCAEFGMVEYLRTNDLYDVAQAIQGSELFIGAQSSCNAICEGLKHDCVLEVCNYAPDCLHMRPNILHYISGPLEFNVLGKHFHAEGAAPRFDPNNPPRGGFKVTIGGKTMIDYEFIRLEQMARAEALVQQVSLSIAEIREKIAQESFQPIPFHLQKKAA